MASFPRDANMLTQDVQSDEKFLVSLSAKYISATCEAFCDHDVAISIRGSNLQTGLFGGQ
jgi:hypothetical protein